MKYLKLYENIDFDDISEEEFDNNIHIKQGDILLPNQDIKFWDSDMWVTFTVNKLNTEIIDIIELSDNITGNPYDNIYKQKFEKIPNGEILFSIKGTWPWYKYDKNIKIK